MRAMRGVARKMGRLCAVGWIAVFLLFGAIHPAEAQPVVLGWRDTGITVPDGFLNSAACFAPGQSNVLLNVEAGVGTVAYNWQTGQRTVVSARPLTACGPGDFLLAGPGAGQPKAWRFSLSDPTGQPLDHVPTQIAQDGSLQVYALDPATPDPAMPGGRLVPVGPGSLWASSDGGQTWQQRGRQFLGKLESLAVSAADSRAIYAVTADRDWNDPPPLVSVQVPFHVYFSPDAGMTWEERFSGQAEGLPVWAGPRINLQPVQGSNVPVGVVQIVLDPGYPGSSNYWQANVSNDGAHTFHAAGEFGLGVSTQIVYAEGALLRMQWRQSQNPQLTASTDGGATWQARPLPPVTPDPYRGLTLETAQAAPGNLFLSDSTYLWYSNDGGQTWEQFANKTGDGPIYLSPYLPLTVLAVQDQHLYALDLPGAGSALGARVTPNEAPDDRFFAETGHNLSGIFAQYWTAHGGLAQQGYPITEPLREVSAVDGKVYLAQYFERAVMEYHPENAPPYNVLLSLLGVFEYQKRYGGGAAPNQQASTDNPRYFAQTGHTVGGKFRAYWESHGGLAQQGYPISDEFTEISALDGKPYTVQYFQRAVFELHPENAGTPYEVLLAQLGAFRFRDTYTPPPATCSATWVPDLC